MLSLDRFLRPAAVGSLLLILAATLAGCSMFRSEPSTKKGWSIWPWKGSAGQDATRYIEYQRTRSEGGQATYTLVARNTHPKRTIEGQMRTTMQLSPSDMKVDSQSFVLGPNEPKKLLIYPVKYQLTYEVSAVFRD
jgi:hypothetical protein